MEPAYRNTASVQARRSKETWVRSTSSPKGMVEGAGLREREGKEPVNRCGKGEGTDEVICCCLAVSNETCTRFADTYARTTEILT